MKKYEVTFYYHTNMVVVVEAENEKQALERAQAESEKECNIPILLAGLERDDDTDIIESEED